MDDTPNATGHQVYPIKDIWNEDAQVRLVRDADRGAFMQIENGYGEQIVAVRLTVDVCKELAALLVEFAKKELLDARPRH